MKTPFMQNNVTNYAVMALCGMTAYIVTAYISTAVYSCGIYDYVPIGTVLCGYGSI